MSNISNKRGYTLIELLIVGVVFPLIIFAGVFVLWLKLSLLTSGIKTIAGDCGSHYNIPVVSQDWFCPELPEG